VRHEQRLQAIRSPGRSYYQRKIAEGKSRGEAMRALKRHLTNAVHARLTAVHRNKTTRNRPSSNLTQLDHSGR
jgi:hypothetical protein